MKTLRQLCLALVFTFALVLPAFGGEISTTVAPPPTAHAATTDGEIQTGLTGQIETPSSEATAGGSAAEVALNLLQSVLALF
jgi:hypothetical protein